jgi:hypothetical protein
MLNAALLSVRCAIAGISALLLSGSALSAVAGTLETVQQRGVLQCGVSEGLLGFSARNGVGEWSGFDVDFCRAVAGAIFDDRMKVAFVPLSASERFDALRTGRIDLLSRNSTWTLGREAGLGLAFAGITYHDGQGFMVMRDLNVTSALELDRTRVCVETGTTSQLNLADFFRANSMTFEEHAFPTPEARPAKRWCHPSGRDLKGAARAGDARRRLRLVHHREVGQFCACQCRGTRHLIPERDWGDDIAQTRRSTLRRRGGWVRQDAGTG